MLAGEAAKSLGVSVKALRYYEASGLINPARLHNGYRKYSKADLRIVREIVHLTNLGLTVESTRPFVNCLRLGHEKGDSCVESIVAYRDEIRRLDNMIEGLVERRNRLQDRLNKAANAGFPQHREGPSHESYPSSVHSRAVEDPPLHCPDSLGHAEEANKIKGLKLPSMLLKASNGREVELTNVSDGRWVLFIYPTTGVPGKDMPLGWDQIPGARGCTAEACGFRDNLDAIQDAGAAKIYGLSVQESEYQMELAQRLHLRYLLLSDSAHCLEGALNLPTFQANGQSFYKRMTLIINKSTVEHVFYPVSSPGQHARQVLNWFRASKYSSGRSEDMLSQANSDLASSQDSEVV